MISLWSLYLDVDDAAPVLRAVLELERNRAVREPLPLEDAQLLLGRLRTVARISAEDAVYWQREADDREEAAQVDGGRWGSVELATTMRGVATELAETSRDIGVIAEAAARDLAPRLQERANDAVRAAEEATEREARRLLGFEPRADEPPR